jgi:hypothetical protein
MKRYFGSFLRSVFVNIFGNVKEPTIFRRSYAPSFRNNIFIMYRMDEAHTIMAVGNPVRILRDDNVVLLAKNRQLFYANTLNAWLHSDAFYRDFAIPVFRHASPHIQIPHDFEEAILNRRHHNHNYYMEQLSLRAFRLFTIQMRIRADTIEVIIIRAPNELGVLAYVDDIHLIPQDILHICIRKILFDNLLLGRARDTPFIATCDLYLDRPAGTRGGFHNDSNYYGGVDRVPGSENLEYLSLLLLLENNTSLVRGTSIMARLQEGENRQRFAISLPSMNGTNIIIHDNSFLHATPMPNIEHVERRENLEQVSHGIRPRSLYTTDPIIATVDVVHERPHITANRHGVLDTELQRHKPRQFIRCHYISNPIIVGYVEVPNIMNLDFLRHIFGSAIADYNQENPADTIHNVIGRADLNIRLRQLTQGGHTIGGKKTKKRNKKTKKQKTYRRNVHMRGGVDKDQDQDKDQSIIITSDKKDMYDVSKYNTGAELVIDMDNGLYIEINELNPV